MKNICIYNDAFIYVRNENVRKKNSIKVIQKLFKDFMSSLIFSILLIYYIFKKR